uniref:Uncharacterized protein LOC107470369 n=1 Tax=Rhizophora mucronata TaxID=61149 RepID=A0A2P2KG41_RHIMU
MGDCSPADHSSLYIEVTNKDAHLSCHVSKMHNIIQRSSLRTLLESDIISIIIFSGESSQFAKAFKSTCKTRKTFCLSA